MGRDPARVGQNCEFCGSPALVDYQEIKSPIRPQSVLPFKVPQDQVRDGIRRWYASKWFAPGALKKKALVDRVKSLDEASRIPTPSAACPPRRPSQKRRGGQRGHNDHQNRSRVRAGVHHRLAAER